MTQKLSAELVYTFTLWLLLMSVCLQVHSREQVSSSFQWTVTESETPQICCLNFLRREAVSRHTLQPLPPKRVPEWDQTKLKPSNTDEISKRKINNILLYYLYWSRAGESLLWSSSQSLKTKISSKSAAQLPAVGCTLPLSCRWSSHLEASSQKNRAELPAVPLWQTTHTPVTGTGSALLLLNLYRTTTRPLILTAELTQYDGFGLFLRENHLLTWFDRVKFP